MISYLTSILQEQGSQESLFSLQSPLTEDAVSLVTSPVSPDTDTSVSLPGGAPLPAPTPTDPQQPDPAATPALDTTPSQGNVEEIQTARTENVDLETPGEGSTDTNVEELGPQLNNREAEGRDSVTLRDPGLEFSEILTSSGLIVVRFLGNHIAQITAAG